MMAPCSQLDEIIWEVNFNSKRILKTLKKRQKKKTSKNKWQAMKCAPRSRRAEEEIRLGKSTKDQSLTISSAYIKHNLSISDN